MTHGSAITCIGAIAVEIVRALTTQTIVFARIGITSVDHLTCVENDLMLTAVFLQRD